MEIVIWSIIFCLTLFILVKAADYFTIYSEKLGLLLGLSSFIIGATIVAIGTSLPELVSSLYAVLGSGETVFVVDTIVGSNIANALLILGIGAVVAGTLKVHTSLIDVDLPFFFMSLGLFSLFAFDGKIIWTEAIFLVLFFIIFVIYSVKSEHVVEDNDELMQLRTQFNGSPLKVRVFKIIKYTSFILMSAVLIAFSAKYFIDSLLTISTLAGISSSLLTVSVVAIGTSLPEILTSIAAIRIGNHGMAIGNVFGSNIFNIALVGSLPAFFSTLSIAPTTLRYGIPFLILASFIVIFTTIDNKVPRWEGIGMLLVYCVFLGLMFGIF